MEILWETIKAILIPFIALFVCIIGLIFLFNEIVDEKKKVEKVKKAIVGALIIAAMIVCILFIAVDRVSFALVCAYIVLTFLLFRI